MNEAEKGIVKVQSKEQSLRAGFSEEVELKPGLEEKEVFGTEQKAVEHILEVEKEIRERKMYNIVRLGVAWCSEGQLIHNYLGFKVIFKVLKI